MRTKRNETEKLITDIQNMERINESIKAFNNEISDIFQVGGNATIGKGFVKILNKEGALVE